ncbi:hypothetical protein AS593_10580 [Caulobacter vibrioides]|nr:hypothetical protein AS593_10580 [Caulobacter vibrioides]
MEARSVRTPLSIKITVGCFLIGLTIKLIGFWTVSKLDGALTPLWLSLAGIETAAIVYQIVALPRLSRWAPIVQTALVAGFMVWRFIQNPHWTDNYPMTGVLALIVPTAVYLALVLPHWRKMNWAPLGLPYRIAENPADVF